jgi:hypothetical protein
MWKNGIHTKFWVEKLMGRALTTDKCGHPVSGLDAGIRTFKC